MLIINKLTLSSATSLLPSLAVGEVPLVPTITVFSKIQQAVRGVTEVGMI